MRTANSYAVISLFSVQAKIFDEGGIKITLRPGNVWLPDRDSPLFSAVSELLAWASDPPLNLRAVLSADHLEMVETLADHWEEIHRVFENLGRCERFVHRLFTMYGQGYG